jgi:2-polyprenyl-6-methoxyphenol hydroxylase-like FAD-dependent oxidoreductase
VRVLVVGAGLGGLALTRALRLELARGPRCAGVAVDVVERASAFGPLGVGIVLHPNGMRALSRLGLAEEVRAAGAVLRVMEIVRGDTTLRLPLREVWPDADQPTVAILRPALHDVLVRDLFEDGGARLRMDHPLPGVDAIASTPRAHFADGSSEAYDLVVGADGVSSALRRALSPEVAPLCTGLLYWRFAAHDVIALGADTWRTFERPEGSFGFIPVGGGKVHCFVQLRREPPSMPCPPGGEEAHLRSVLARWHADLAATIEARCGALHVGFAMMVRPVCWGAGRCVLLGDAAHAVSPTLSEGGSLAMEDGLVLAEQVAGLAAGRTDVDEALALFRTARTEPVLWALRMAAAQVGSMRRSRQVYQTDPGVAVQHMRRMYEPLWLTKPAKLADRDP